MTDKVTYLLSTSFSMLFVVVVQYKNIEDIDAENKVYFAHICVTLWQPIKHFFGFIFIFLS